MSTQHIPLQVQQAGRRLPILWATVGLLCVLAVGATRWYEIGRDVVLVETTSPRITDLEATVSSTGTVVPVEDFPARATFSGSVDNIFVHVGQTVSAGQMLITMKDQFAQPRVRNASVELHTAEVALQNIENNGSREDHIGFDVDLTRSQMERDAAVGSLAVIKQLNSRGSASDDEVGGAMQRVQSAQIALDAIKRRLHDRYSPEDLATWKEKVEADKASLAAERTSWANANISSPISGTVYMLPVSRYDFVPAGGDLLHVADLTHVQVRSDFYIPDVGSLRIGAPVTIRWDGRPDRTWAGHITSRPMAVNGGGVMTTGRCLIALDSPLGELPINSTVSVTITAQKHNHVLAIPREALYTEPQGHYVFRVLGNRLKKTPVTVDMINPMQAEITSGLTATDIVALHAGNNLPLSEDLDVKVAR